jgi:hypothetical protein
LLVCTGAGHSQPQHPSDAVADSAWHPPYVDTRRGAVGGGHVRPIRVDHRFADDRKVASPPWRLPQGVAAWSCHRIHLSNSFWGQGSAFPRRDPARGHASFLDPPTTEGAGNAGSWPPPWPACKTKSRRQSPQILWVAGGQERLGLSQTIQPRRIKMIKLDRTDTPAAVAEHATVYPEFELSQAKWKLGVLLPSSQKLSRTRSAAATWQPRPLGLRWRRGRPAGAHPVMLRSRP